MGGAEVALAAIALVTAILTVVVKPLFELLRANTKALEHLAKSSEKAADGNKEVAKELRQGNKEAKDRNGHLGEQNIEIIGIVKEISDNLKK